MKKLATKRMNLSLTPVESVLFIFRRQRRLVIIAAAFLLLCWTSSCLVELVEANRFDGSGSGASLKNHRYTDFLRPCPSINLKGLFGEPCFCEQDWARAFCLQFKFFNRAAHQRDPHTASSPSSSSVCLCRTPEGRADRCTQFQIRCFGGGSSFSSSRFSSQRHKVGGILPQKLLDQKQQEERCSCCFNQPELHCNQLDCAGMQPSFEGGNNTSSSSSSSSWKCLCWDRLRQPAPPEICDDPDSHHDDASSIVVDIVDDESLPFNQKSSSEEGEEDSSAGGSVWQRAPGLLQKAHKPQIDRKNDGSEAATKLAAAAAAAGNSGGRQRSLLSSKSPLARTTGGSGRSSSSSASKQQQHQRREEKEKDYAQMTALVFAAAFAGSLCIGAGVFFYTRRKDRKKQQQEHDKAPNNTMVSAVSLQQNQQQKQREQHQQLLVKRVPASEASKELLLLETKKKTVKMNDVTGNASITSGSRGNHHEGRNSNGNL